MRIEDYHSYYTCEEGMVDSLTTCIEIKKVMVVKIVRLIIILITILILVSTIKMKGKVIPIVLVFVIIKVLNNNNTYGSHSPSVNTIELVILDSFTHCDQYH